MPLPDNTLEHRTPLRYVFKGKWQRKNQQEKRTMYADTNQKYPWQNDYAQRSNRMQTTANNATKNLVTNKKVRFFAHDSHRSARSLAHLLWAALRYELICNLLQSKGFVVSEAWLCVFFSSLEANAMHFLRRSNVLCAFLEKCLFARHLPVHSMQISNRHNFSGFQRWWACNTSASNQIIWIEFVNIFNRMPCIRVFFCFVGCK